MKKKIIRIEQVETPILQDASLLMPLRRVFANRGIQQRHELDYPLAQLQPWNLMHDINRAVKRIGKAILHDENILVIGDYDADGATSTAIAVQALKSFGATKVQYFIPDRFRYGYGLSAAIIDAVLPKQPNLIITVDNGISSIEGVDRANQNQMDVIITDHHLAPTVLPAAYATVNPNHPESRFPSKHLAGVGVIFYVMLALRERLKSLNWFEQKNIQWPNMAQYLDLVALGTIADLVPLDYNNRLLVHHGLLRIRAGKTRPGIQALLQLAKRSITQTVSSDLAFAVAPRLNAAGRLHDMSIGVECLLSKDRELSKNISKQLDALNSERRTLETDMQYEALQIVNKLHLTDTLPLGLCLYDKQWHPGVVGLVASKIKEKTHRPVIAFSKDEQGFLKGSARSIVNLHIRDLLCDITRQYPSLIHKFGGHSMAAGLVVLEDNFKLFQKVFNDYVTIALKDIGLEDFIKTDGKLHSRELTLELADAIRYASVWGKAFEEPLFDGKFKLLDQRIVGQKHLKLVLQFFDSDRYINAIHFHADLKQWPNYQCQSVHVVYRLNVNEYMERRYLQLIVEYIEPIFGHSM